ncbi:MAG: FAD-dependent oxidoreductase [Acidimicrobiia bacterium]
MDDNGTPGTPLTSGEWKTIIDDLVDNPDENVALWNVATPEEDDREFDAIFIGGGAAGRFGSAYSKARGGRQLVIDKWSFLGGSCPHEACFPHHVFSECAKELDLQRHMAGRLWFPEFDEKAVRILDVIELFRQGRGIGHGIMNWQSKEQLDMEFVLNQKATVIDNHTVEVAGQRFTTKNLVLATGARTAFPDIPGLDQKGVYDFASVLTDLDFEPNRCVIIGGSKVAMEYGCFFHATGCKTTILSRSPLMETASLQHMDEEMRLFVIEMMEERGMEILEGVEPVAVLGDGTASGVRYRDAAGNEFDIDCDFVFVATGENPLSQPLVEALGLETTERGFIKVDHSMRTSVPNVYAAGDLIGHPMEMFKARLSGVCAARNIMGEDYEFHFEEYPDFFHTTYEVQWTGLSEEEAREQYDDVVVIKFPPEGADPEVLPLPLGDGSMLYGFTRPKWTGFSKLLIDGDSRRIVGAHHTGFGAKDAFQYLHYLIHDHPGGWTIDQMGELKELFINNENFIQLCRLRAGQQKLRDL